MNTPGQEITQSVTAKIADELRHNDECASREPLSDDEYMDDAAAILRIIAEHNGDALLGSGPINALMAERDRLARENEILRRALEVIGRPGETYGLSDKLARSVALSALGELGPLK